MKKEVIRKKTASIALSIAMAGSIGTFMTDGVFAVDEVDNTPKVENPIEEDVVEEVKEETIKEEPKKEVKQEEVNEENVYEEKVEEDVVEEEKVDEINKEEEVKEEVVEENTVKATANSESTPESNNNRGVIHEDHKVSVVTTKVDEEGNPLVGAVLQILDKDGNVVDEWVSDGSEHVSMLPEGEYTLHEKSAPEGYQTAEDKPFTVKVEILDMDAGVDFSETPCNHYGGTPLYYVESEGEKQEVYCINQDWETPDENSIYDGAVLTPSDIRDFTQQTVYTDAYQNTGKTDVSDQSLTSQELYDKILDIIYHRQQATELFSDLTEAEIRYVTESALKNYTNAGLTRVQRVGINQAPSDYEETDYYITDDGRYMWYLYPWYRSFVYDPDAPLGQDIFRMDINGGDAFGTLARHWSSGHNAKNSEEVRAKVARYYELYLYLINGEDRHPSDMYLYIFTTDNKAIDWSGYDFDEGSYQNLLGIRWYNPEDESYKIYLPLIDKVIDEPEVPDNPDKPTTPDTPKAANVSKTVEHSPQTGDDPYLELALAGLGLSLAGMGTTVFARRRKKI